MNNDPDLILGQHASDTDKDMETFISISTTGVSTVDNLIELGSVSTTGNPIERSGVNTGGNVMELGGVKTVDNLIEMG